MTDDNFSNLDRAHSNPGSNADDVQHVGPASVLEAVEGVHFPVKKQDLIQDRGEATVNLTGHQSEKLRVLLLRTDAEEFFSVTDLVQKIETAI
jgi:hypothetical protein